MRRMVRALAAAGIVSSMVAGGATAASAGPVCDSTFHVIASPNAPSGAAEVTKRDEVFGVEG